MNIKKYWLALLIIIFQFSSGQILDPVKISMEIKDLGNNEYEAILHTKIDKNWHVYSKDLPEDSGIPTEMILTSKDGIELLGKVKEVGKKHNEFSEAFQAQIIYYSNQVDFIQKFRRKNPNKPTSVVAEITYQTCDDKVCLAPNTLEFEKKLSVKTAVNNTNIGLEDNPKDNNTVLETPASVEKIEDSSVSIINENAINPISSAKKREGLLVSTLDFKNPLTNCGLDEIKNKENFWTYLLLGFFGGFIALLTPCVFPMIPLTVSFFTKGSLNKSKKDALIYGFFIFIIFVLLSVPFHIVDGIAGNIFNQISTNVWLNLVFFLLFLFFAGSFFGYYDITLPNSIANKSSHAEEAGGKIGIFFMALTLVIVSFSCTGPILGSLLGSAITGSANVPMLLTYALAGFGLSWAIVFGLLALFPQALQSLPKSGGWMNTVKIFLGFIELGLALKFLSKADLVSKTMLLKRELFIFIWIIITLGLVLYAFGIIRFPYDDKNAKISNGKKIMGILGIGFIIYLAQGLIPSERPKLQLLSGILPPLNVSYFQDEKDGILGMHPIHDYDEAIAVAKKENKPLLIDFTGYGCENCRKMEEFVWSEPDILPILQNDVILASLFVDDKEKLPEEEQVSVDQGNGQRKKIKTIGDKWSLFQTINFNNNSQPHYVLVTPDEKVINRPVSGYMDKEDYKKFLECGVNYYKKNQ